MPYKKSESDSEPQPGGAPFGGKVDDIVAKAIPQNWLATSFAIAAVAAFLFFILMIIGFATGGPAVGPEAQKLIDDEKAKAEAEVTRYKGIAEEARKAQDAAKKDLSDAVNNLRAAERKAATVDRAEASQKKTEEALANLKKEYQGLEARLREETAAKRQAEGKVTRAEGERDAAFRERDNVRDQMNKTAASLTDLRKKYDDLSKQKTAEADRVEKARAAFDSIMAKAGAEEDLEKRVELLRKLRDESLSELGGTTYAKELGDKIVQVEQQIQREQAIAKKADVQKAAEVYKNAMRSAKMAADHASAMEILRAAKDEVTGTDYELRIHNEIEGREKAEKERVARETYDNAMKKLRETPDAHEENLQALKAAAEQVAGTAYEPKLKALADQKEKTLADDIARAAYTALNGQIGKAPTDYDANIAAAEDALAKAKGSRYEAKIQSILTTQQTKRLDAIGSEAYKKSVDLVKASKDRAANVAELEAQKAKAAGSTWEAKIDALLAREKKLLAREKK